MSNYRYDPGVFGHYSGAPGGTATSVPQGMASGNDYPGAPDGGWFQAGGYTPNGNPLVVYIGTSIAAHASAFPAGKDITGCEVACLAGTYSHYGLTTTEVGLAAGETANSDVIASRTYPNATPAWSRTVAPDFFVGADDVASFLALTYMYVNQTVPSTGNVRVDYFSAYVSFTVGMALEVTIPVVVGGPGEASEKHIGGTFPAVVF